MKFVADQDKIAGQATQKSPSVNATSPATAIAASGSASKVRLPVDFSSRDTATQPISLLPLPGAGSISMAAATASAVQPAAQVERLEQLITREAVSFKSASANEVGVTLKVDANTQIFLQLTYRDGQTLAQLRFEKGDLPALTSHFSQLQESLARQNIQLQPSGAISDFGRQNSSGRQPQQTETAPAPRMKDAAPSKPALASQPKPRTSARHGFDRWA